MNELRQAGLLESAGYELLEQTRQRPPASAAALSVPASAAATRPNLLIIPTDEHSFRMLGCYRNPSPPLDKIHLFLLT